MIVVLIIAIIAAIATPNFMAPRATSAKTACLANMHEIDSAKEQLAMVNDLQDGAPVAWSDLVPTYLKKQPQCPSGGTYTVNSIGSLPSCSLAGIGHQS